MLTSLKIKNFQSLRKLTIELSPEITCLIGPTNAGKSAALRALRLLCSNKPSGSAFVSHGSARCELTLEVDGRQIKRVRSSSANSYFLDDKEFVAFGPSVPPEMIALLRVSELNFQGQHDPPFWLSLSAPEVSRELNRIVDLSLIDESLGRAGAEVRKAVAALEVTTQRHREAKLRCEDTEFVPELVDLLTSATKIREDLTRSVGTSETLKLLLRDIRSARESCVINTTCCAAASGLAGSCKQLNKLTEQRDSLTELLTCIRALRETLAAHTPALDRPDAVAQRLDALLGRRDSLRGFLDCIAAQKRALWDRESELGKTNKELEGLRIKTCPACGRPVG